MRATFIILSVLLTIVLAALIVFRHPAFGPHPFGGIRAEVAKSPHYREGRFQNEIPTPQFTGKRASGGGTSFWEGLSAMWKFMTDRTNERVPESPVETERIDVRQAVHSVLSNPAPDTSDVFIWFGHSSYLFTLGGRTVLVDPLLKMEFPASLLMKPFPGTDIYTPDDMPDIDILIVTHEHWDHLDYATLRDLRSKVRHVVCPLGIADYFIHWGYPSTIITEMDWYQSVSLPEPKDNAIEVHCLPTRHFSNRLFGANQTLWASFMLDFNGKKIYVGGDGGYDDRFQRIHDRFGEVDLAVMENGQYNTNWAYIHMLPAHLEQAMLELQAKHYITVHHDKFSLAPHAWNEPDSVAQEIANNHPQSIHILDRPIGHVIQW